MAHRTGIQWTKRQSLALSRSVKNFNARRAAAIKRGVSLDILPPKQTVKRAKQIIGTGAELKSYINTLSKATKKTLVQDTDVPYTVFEVQETLKGKGARIRDVVRTTENDWVRPEDSKEAQRQARLEEKRRAKLAQAEMEKSTGKLPTDRDELIRSLSEENLGNLDEWAKNIQGSEQWRQNYLDRLDKFLSEAIQAGERGEKLDKIYELYKKVSGMELIDFLLGQLMNPGELEIPYLYPSGGESYGDLAERAIRAWDEVLV